MVRAWRRQRKLIAGVLLLSSLSGGRVITVMEPCDKCHDYFSANLAFKVVARTALHTPEHKRPINAITSSHIHSAHDLELIGTDRSIVPVIAALPAVLIRPHASIDGAVRHAKLPFDLDPAYSFQLQL